MLKRLLLLGLVLGLSGCATPEFQHAGKYKLYASISKGTDNEFRVDSLSNEGGNVDLNNGEFTGDKSGIDCRRVVCKRGEVPDFFRQHSVSPAHELGNGLGVGYDSSVNYKRIDYSNHHFKVALQKALMTSNIDRDKTISQYDSYVDRHDKKVDKFTLPPEKFNELLKQ
jgi:hypothetical protein